MISTGTSVSIPPLVYALKSKRRLKGNICIKIHIFQMETIVVSIGLFLSHFVHFYTMEYVRPYESFLLVPSWLVKKVPMEKEIPIFYLLFEKCHILKWQIKEESTVKKKYFRKCMRER